MKLTNTACRTAKAKDKPYKMADGGGLFLLIKPDGSKYWRMKYRFLGKEKLLAFGTYPLISLADAREEREAAKKLLAGGIDPAKYRKEEKRRTIRNAQNTFKAVALEWHQNQKDRWSDNHAQNVLHRLETDIFPYIGAEPLASIEAPDLLDTLRKIEKRGAQAIPKRSRQT